MRRAGREAGHRGPPQLGALPARAEVQSGDFEEYPLQEGAFHLAASATAFHWLDPAVAYPLPESGPRAPALGGHGPLVERARPQPRERGLLRGRPKEVYERQAPEMVKPEDHKGLPGPQELPDRTEGMEACGLFAGVLRRE
jgi:hypothetical protein